MNWKIKILNIFITIASENYLISEAMHDLYTKKSYKNINKNI